MWKYKEYKSSNGTRPVENWYEKLPHQDRARVKAFLFRIKDLSVLQMPHCRNIKGHKGLWEVRCGASRPYRILYYSPSGCVLIFLCGCYHQDKNNYEPSGALDTADKNRNEIEKGVAYACRVQFLAMGRTGE